jgi:hypothetical protein
VTAPSSGSGPEARNAHGDALWSRLRELEHRQAIADLYSSYAWLIDRHNWESVADEIFTEDAVLDLGAAIPSAVGRTAIRETFAGFGRLLEGTAHFITNVRVDELLEDRATTQAYFQSFHWSAETAGAPTRPVDFVGAGVYLDELRLEGGRWWIARRRRRNLGPSPLALGVVPPSHQEALREWGGEPDHDRTPQQRKEH